MTATVHTGTATAVVPTKAEFDALTKTVTDLATGVAALVQQYNLLLAEVLTDENRIKQLEAPPVIIPPPPPVVIPPPVTGLPDPLLLPAAVQQVPDPLAYDLLNVPSWAPGQSYTDPLTGITIVKLTSPTSPVPGMATEMCGVDYATGGLRIGRPTNGVYPITVYRSPDGTGDYHVITFSPSTKAVGYRCPAPGVSSREISRAMSYVVPNVMYAFSGAVLHKYDISGLAPVEISGGVWPKDWSAHLHGQSRFVWLQSTADDRYFAAQAGDTGPWVVVWDSQTDTFYEHQFASFNEFKMSKDSPYIHATGTRVMWDVLNNVERTFTGPTTYLSHNDTLRRYLEACDVNANPGIFTYTDLESPSPAITTISSAFYIGNLYQSGGWVDQARDLTQWVLLAYQTGGSAHPNELLQRGGLGMARLDFSGGLRLLCHTFNLGDVNGTPAYYTNSMWPNMSPDGKFCLFKSNMNRLGGFSSLFAAILPTAPVVIPPPVVVPPPVTGFHEPTGLTPIEVMDWTAGLGAWWLNFIDAAKPISIMPVTDGPLGVPAQILRIGYQQGSSGGGGTELGRWLNVPVSELYWRYWVRVNPQWQGHNSGINKMVYVDDASPPQSGAFSAMWYEMYGGGASPLGLYVVNQTNPSPLGGYVDAQQKPIFSRGVWHLVEIHQRQGQPGQVQVWVDGVLQLDVPANTKAAPIGLLVISGIWGGVGDTKQQTDFMDFGPMWISGR